MRKYFGDFASFIPARLRRTRSLYYPENDRLGRLLAQPSLLPLAVVAAIITRAGAAMIAMSQKRCHLGRCHAQGLFVPAVDFMADRHLVL
jgi:hypothetical protein